MTESAAFNLIFSSDQANHNFARVLGDLRRARHSISHRLRSIRRDAAFVASVAAHYPGLPLVANERCGSWYVPEGRKDASAYFKSTDGHTGQWAVSTRRLNLHLLKLGGHDNEDGREDAEEEAEKDKKRRLTTMTTTTTSSFILVDSTRRGKRMPDALSKTVPLWCCAVNRLVFADHPDHPDAADAPLYTPPGVVSASEHSQMLARAPAQVDALRRVGVLDDRAAWAAHLCGRPLRPVWVTPDMPWPAIDVLAASYTVVVCCTASRLSDNTAVGTGPADDSDQDYSSYIQGAADDTENWAHGLTPTVFWNHSDELLATPEADLPARIGTLMAAERQGRASSTPASPVSSPTLSSSSSSSYTSITPYLSVGATAVLSSPAADATRHTPSTVCDIIFVRRATASASWVLSPTRLEVGLGKQDKTAGRNLRHALPQICAFVSAYLGRPESESGFTKHVRVACDSGRDVSIGTALALLCTCFDADGQPLPPPLKQPAEPSNTDSRPAVFTKDAIRVRLGRIMTVMPQANPSRTTLQSVNSFLMG